MRIRVAALLALLCCCASMARAQELVVSAAASLTDAFRAAGKDFEAKRPGATVLFNFASSDVLVAQIVKGAPADVFASADQEAMSRASAAGAIADSTRRDFAANQLVLAVARSAIVPTTLADLGGQRFRRIALGSPQTVPAGRYAKEALERANLWTALEPKLVYAQNVRQVLDYVAREEAEAGFVYATDAAIMAEKVKVAFDVATATPVRYPIAVVRDSKQAQLAEAFVAYVVSGAGQQILRRYGFRAP